MKPPLRGEGAYLRGFKPVHEQEKLVGAILLRSIRINGSSLSLVSFRHLLVCSLTTYILYQHISSFRMLEIYHIVFSQVGR